MAATEGLGMLIEDLAKYFYASDGLVASTQPERLQRAFGVLTDFLDRVGLHTNTQKMARMACQPYHMPDRMLMVAYERMATGTGLAYRERKRMRVQCLEYGVELAAGSLLTQCQS